MPESVPLRIHVMEDDELGDVEVARTLGFADATALVLARVRDFLGSTS